MSETPVGARALKVMSERSERAIAIRKQASAGNKAPKKKVLEEDEFVAKIDKIIERDFFPYLETVNKQTKYLDALESHDSVRIAQAERELGKTPQSAIGDTPSKEGWDDDDWVKGTPGPSSKPAAPKDEKLKKDVEGVSLTEFMTKNTSEDNDSFAQIMEKAERKRREKLDWVYKHEKEEQQQEDQPMSIDYRGSSKSVLGVGGDEDDAALMPPPPGAPLALTTAGDSRLSQPLDSWKFKVHNTVMYYPEGSPLTDDEAQQLKDGRVQISHAATRLSTRPWTSASLKPAAAATSTQPGVPGGVGATAKGDDGFWNGVVEKLGPDGKQSWELASPRPPAKKGFSLVATPSPRPGVNESPLMTWGEVDSTPYLIDHVGDGSQFRMKGPSEREQLAHTLAEKHSALKKKKKQAALTTLSEEAGHHQGNSVPQSPRFSALSPAAKRLAVGKLGISRGADKRLIASYTPSPRPGEKGRPFDSVGVSPFPSPSPVGSLRSGNTPNVVAQAPSDVKKAKASDFF